MLSLLLIKASTDSIRSTNSLTESMSVWAKVAHTRLPSVGLRSWSRFLAVSLQVTWIVNLAVGCHYFPPGLQLPSQPLRGLLQILLLGEQWMWTVCLRLLPDNVATAIWTQALLCLSPARWPLGYRATYLVQCGYETGKCYRNDPCCMLNGNISISTPMQQIMNANKIIGRQH